jgi:heme-degrading monooxygenase HmoA
VGVRVAASTGKEAVMHAAIRTFEGSPEFADTLVEHESDVRGVIEEIDGFRAYYLIKTSDATLSVSVFEDQAGAEESTRAAGAWVAENLGDQPIPEPRIFTGEVVISL